MIYVDPCRFWHRRTRKNEVIFRDDNDNDNDDDAQVLEVCTEEEQVKLLTRMRNHLATLRKFTYGKHIAARVEKMVQQQAAEQGTAFAA
eukprot:6018350-Pyramimonas_sp.AAC.2